MRKSIGMLLLLLAAGAIGVIVGRSIAPPAPPLLRDERETRAGLDQTIDEIDFRETPLIKAVDVLRRKSGKNIVVRWRTLEAAGVEQTVPVTLRLTKLPLDRVLTLLCNEASVVVGVELGWSVDRETVILTTADENSSYTQIRLYDVRDLIEAHYAYRVRLGWRPTTSPSDGSMLGAVSSTGDSADPRAEAVEMLTHLISENVAPDAWRDAGGTVGSIREIDGRFVITATPPMHDDIARLLELLRKGR